MRFLGPFFLTATFIAGLLPNSSERHFELSCSFLVGLFITLLNKNQLAVPSQVTQSPFPEFIEDELETSVMMQDDRPTEAVSKLPYPEKFLIRESFEAKYKQLREQFDAKNQVLASARQELFRVENQLQVLQKANEENYFQEEAYTKEIAGYLQCIQELSDEVDLLQATITSLLDVKKKAVGRPRKLKRKEPEDLLSSLM